MPRVGSSKMMTRGCIASHLASTTFCWLPPESEPTGVADARRADAEAAPLGPRRAPSRGRRPTMPTAGRGRAAAAARCSRRSAGRARRRWPCGPRARGRCRWAIASRGERDRDRLAVEPDAAGHQRVDAEDGAGELGAARRRPARRGRGSRRAAASRSTLAVGIGRGARADDLEQRLAGRRRRAGGRSTSGRGRSSAGSSRRGVISSLREVADQPAVAQHDDAVGAGGRPR